MQAGKLQQLITIEKPVENQDPVTGNLVTTWTALPLFTRIFAEVLPDRAQQFFAARQQQSTTNAEIRLYYQPGIDSTMRVVHHVRPGMDQYWDIEGVVVVQSKQTELRLMCLQREAEGYMRGADVANPA